MNEDVPTGPAKTVNPSPTGPSETDGERWKPTPAGLFSITATSRDPLTNTARRLRVTFLRPFRIIARVPFSTLAGD